jgi:hypothetical protein
VVSPGTTSIIGVRLRIGVKQSVTLSLSTTSIPSELASGAPASREGTRSFSVPRIAD